MWLRFSIRLIDSKNNTNCNCFRWGEGVELGVSRIVLRKEMDGMEKNHSFMPFFYDWRVPFEAMSGEDCKRLLLAMIRYHEDGTEPPEFQLPAGLSGRAGAFPPPRFSKRRCAGRRRRRQIRRDFLQRRANRSRAPTFRRIENLQKFPQSRLTIVGSRGITNSR